MATKKEDTKVQYLPNIKPGTPEMETFLAAGYPDIGTCEHARELIADRKKDTSSVPWDVVKRAEAFLAAYEATAKVIDPTPGRLDDIQTR